jgi:hypothetical protein
MVALIPVEVYEQLVAEREARFQTLDRLAASCRRSQKKRLKTMSARLLMPSGIQGRKKIKSLISLYPDYHYP